MTSFCLDFFSTFLFLKDGIHGTSLTFLVLPSWTPYPPPPSADLCSLTTAAASSRTSLVSQATLDPSTSEPPAPLPVAVPRPQAGGPLPTAGAHEVRPHRVLLLPEASSDPLDLRGPFVGQASLKNGVLSTCTHLSYLLS